MTTTFEQHHTHVSFVGPSAWALVLAALMQIVLGIPLAHLQAETPPSAAIVALNSLSHLLLMVGLAGLARSGATAQARLGTVGLGLSQLGFAVIVVAELSWLFESAATEVLFGVGTLVLMVGLTLAGVAVLRAGRWRGWRRFTPLACGVYIGLIVLPAFALPGYASNYAIGIWGVCWLLLGLALRAEREAP
jgi:hypothetical protein